tara:strand:- start:192 stop:545 length:354 start_codon:yes stop_codon:yes gene_type:complete
MTELDDFKVKVVRQDDRKVKTKQMLFEIKDFIENNPHIPVKINLNSDFNKINCSIELETNDFFNIFVGYESKIEKEEQGSTISVKKGSICFTTQVLFKPISKKITKGLLRSLMHNTR